MDVAPEGVAGVGPTGSLFYLRIAARRKSRARRRSAGARGGRLRRAFALLY
jgi:hypothetical protein